MLYKNPTWLRLLILLVAATLAVIPCSVVSEPQRILLDTDVDTDDLFAILYLLKLNRSEFDLKGITINTNSWSDAGHAVNHLYDLLFMMDRDDIPVGVGGDGGISEDGTILPNVGGYLPIIEQRTSTVGYCRYRQAIPPGGGGRLDVDTNFGVRKSFLPQGKRKYLPLSQPTVQQVMVDVISEALTTVFLTGSHTNFALFLMKYPHLKKNVKHVYAMGGGVRSKNPIGCCPANSTDCTPGQCGDPGNMFIDYTSNPYAEFNIFADPFAAYHVIHSGIPVTLVPLDATNTIPITKIFFQTFQKNQKTYEAQYCFMSLKMQCETWFDDQFFTSYFMWDSFTSGVAVSIMRKAENPDGENEFAEMEFMNITVVTSNQPYGINDGSNPFYNGHHIPNFHLQTAEVHSGHVQTGLRDPFCIAANGTGICQDGYTKETTGSDSVRVLVATKAKPNKDPKSPLDREYFVSFLEVLNHPHQSGRFNITTQFPHYKEVFYKPNREGKSSGRTVAFDMDMSAGDFLSLIYLLKVPTEVINLKAIFITPTGWAGAATIDVVYDLLHMMGRDDILVGLGGVFGMNQSDASNSAVGDCKYQKSIPHGSGGLLDSDTLYGLARTLPRSPRRYTAENSVKHGAPRDTGHPELRQPLASDIWENITKQLPQGTKLTILTNGPLTTLAKLITSHKNASSFIQDVFVVGGHTESSVNDKGNVFSIPTNHFAEFDMFLDPFAAKTVFDSDLSITLIPLSVQRKVSSFHQALDKLYRAKRTPELHFGHRLLSLLQSLQKKHRKYKHLDIFLGEILGSVILAENVSVLKSTCRSQHIKVLAEGNESVDGQMEVDEKDGKLVNILEDVDYTAYYRVLADRLADKRQSAVVGSFSDQEKMWSTPKKQNIQHD